MATRMPADVHQTFQSLHGVESRIADHLRETADELAHAECFDEEQRAEIYAILQALQNDSENHRAMIELLGKKIAGGACDA